MFRSVLSWLLLAPLVFAPCVAAQSAPVLQNPLFGLRFTPAPPAFEELSPGLRSRCQLAAGSRFWVVAHARFQTSEFFIVQSGAEESSALWLQGEQCRTAEASWVLSGVPKAEYPEGGYEGLPGFEAAPLESCRVAGRPCNYSLRSAREEAILRYLVKDGLRRAAQSAGGFPQLRKQLCEQPLDAGRASHPVVYREQQTFCARAE